MSPTPDVANVQGGSAQRSTPLDMLPPPSAPTSKRRVDLVFPQLTSPQLHRPTMQSALSQDIHLFHPSLNISPSPPSTSLSRQPLDFTSPSRMQTSPIRSALDLSPSQVNTPLHRPRLDLEASPERVHSAQPTFESPVPHHAHLDLSPSLSPVLQLRDQLDLSATPSPGMSTLMFLNLFATDTPFLYY